MNQSKQNRGISIHSFNGLKKRFKFRRLVRIDFLEKFRQVNNSVPKGARPSPQLTVTSPWRSNSGGEAAFAAPQAEVLANAEEDVNVRTPASEAATEAAVAKEAAAAAGPVEGAAVANWP